MRVLITRYPASEDRLIVRPLLCRRCALRLQPPLPTEQRKFRPLVERTWAGTELSLPRGATSMLGAAQCHGFGGGYRQSVPPSAMPMLGACKSLLPEQSKQRDAKNARFSNLIKLNQYLLRVKSMLIGGAKGLELDIATRPG